MTMTVNGVRFRLGELHWEDAFGVMRSELPKFSVLRRGAPQGRIIKTAGWVAKIGRYWLVLTEHGAGPDIYDFTLVPVRPKVIAKWSGKNK
jgi:hypothetical protein